MGKYRHDAKIVAVGSTSQWRTALQTLLVRTDVVLEIGCGSGGYTSLIAAKGIKVIGIDNNIRLIEAARRVNPEIVFEHMDAFDLKTVSTLKPPFSVIVIDLWGLNSYSPTSGYGSLFDVIHLVNLYSSAFHPRLIIIKSDELRRFINLCSTPTGKSKRDADFDEEDTEDGKEEKS